VFFLLFNFSSKQPGSNRKKKQKIAKKQNTAHPSDPNMSSQTFQKAKLGPKNNLEKSQR
jgi:hypothetical protein